MSIPQHSFTTYRYDYGSVEFAPIHRAVLTFALTFPDALKQCVVPCSEYGFKVPHTFSRTSGRNIETSMIQGILGLGAAELGTKTKLWLQDISWIRRRFRGLYDDFLTA